ncbi:MAG: hypothetical protein JNJ54_10275 [Myxococcaceae bacterium]|nr:hypothetical protein [Myxococcaceae bacterium]
MVRIGVLLAVAMLSCGRSVLPDEWAAGQEASTAASGMPAAAACEGRVAAFMVPAEVCPPERRGLDDVRRAVVGTWTGTVADTSHPGVNEPATVTFAQDGALTLEARRGFGGPIWPDRARYRLDALTNACDGHAVLFEAGGSRQQGTFWWIRPCGRRLWFSYSSVNAGLRVVHTFRLER